MASPVMLGLQRKHAAKILQSTAEELGECPIQERIVSYRAFGQGYPLIFLPGNLNSRFFQPAWENSENIALKAGFRVIIVDRPGYGASTGPLVGILWTETLDQH
jgi:pimeloyl-ACP methyl ester carboxylesterase